MLYFGSYKAIFSLSFFNECDINQTFTKIRFSERRKNGIKWFFILAKDYQTRTDDDLKIKREIAKIKMRNCF